MELPVLNACARCTALCCRYVAVEIDEPEDDRDYDNIRWYVSHENIQVYQDDEGGWYIQFFTRCRHLGRENECTIHPNHYQICKDYKMRECEFTLGQGGEKRLFRLPEDVDRYLALQSARREARAAPPRASSRNGKGRPSRNGRPHRRQKTGAR